MEKEKPKIDQDQVRKVQDSLKASIFAKIPALNGQHKVYLPELYFKKLSDEEFVVLWSLKGIEIIVNQKTGEYIEKRRKSLGLRREQGSEVVPEGQQPERKIMEVKQGRGRGV